MYHNCSCIEDNLKEKMSSLNYTAEDALRMSTASEGVCDDGCIALPIFAAFSVISILLLAITVIPNVVITIRYVSVSHVLLSKAWNNIVTAPNYSIQMCIR